MTQPSSTALHTSALTSLPLLARGKVRDNYAVGDDRILMVASDRLSAFDVQGEPFIVPMAIPGVAGPSAMAAVMLLANSSPGRTVDWSVALFVAWLATSLILLSSTYLFRWLGRSVLTALERLMGMLLVALSVQMFLDGVVAYVRIAMNA